MNIICYIGIPQQWESPKGVMMRTALHNGYGTVKSLCAALNIPCFGDALELLTEQSSLFSKLTIEAPNIAPSLSKNLYTMQCNNSHHWRINEVTLNRPKFSRNFRYCPICLHEEIITIFQDIKDLMLCPLHSTQIITQCPNCSQNEWWPEANILRCKCGFDRRHSTHNKAILFDVSKLDTFGDSAYIKTLSSIIGTIKICDDIWESRKPIDERSLHLVDSIIEHAKNMITSQIEKFPGFTRRMQLSPWVSSQKLLKLNAFKMLDENGYSEKSCTTEFCCAEVKLKKYELFYSVGGKSALQKDRILFPYEYLESSNQPALQYHHSSLPICKRVKLLASRALDLKLENDLFITNNFTTHKTKALIHCNNKTLKILIDTGYLKSNQYKSDTDSKHTIMISKPSILKFNESYILLQEISDLLKTSLSITEYLLASFNINPEKQVFGVRIYKRDKIYVILNDLNTALSDLEVKLAANLPSAESSVTFKLKEAINSLNISRALLHRRFILTLLIKPHFINGQLYLSQTQIDFISSHLEQNFSVAQSTKILECTRSKFTKLIMLHDLKPSCRLLISNGKWQFLYNKNEIYSLIEFSTKKICL